MGREVGFNFPPQKIISVVPSKTELLYELGLEEQIAGITKFCIHPEKIFRSKTRVGGTKNLNIDKIKEIKPDIIIANKEENTREQLEELSNDFPVWISDVKNLNDAVEMIGLIGKITAKDKKALEIIDKIKHKFEKLDKNISQQKKSAVYLIWQKPFMTVGGDTFISDMMTRSGMQNLFASQQRYPEIELGQLQSLKPEIVLLSSEPFPFKQQHVADLQKELPESKVILADGEMFAWYGSRLILAADYLNSFSSQYLTGQYLR